MSDLKETPLSRWHLDHGARMVPFAGFSMPVQYEGVLAEHATVRERVGLFDITHMGEVYVEGPQAGAWLSGLVTNSILKGGPGQVTYTAMCNEQGRTLDDMLIYRLADARWLVVMNASNHDKIVAWMRRHLPAGVTMDDASDRTGLIAVQGPRSRELLGRLAALADAAARIDALEFYTHFLLDAPDGEWIVSRTGYTGEHGYELYLPAAAMPAVWEELLARGEDLGVRPIGLAARDTLRFEACYCLYGHELSEDWTPLEAGIGWAVKLKKPDGFIGRDALVAQKEAGVPRKLVGLEVAGGPIAREGCPVLVGDRKVGHVTSGTFAPTLARKLALALVESEFAEADLTIEVRGKRLAAAPRALPFLAARVKGDPQAERTLP
ncbi:MAG: glycine cleavage system aminomethyltransferase GcvT [Candidatus Krumholzibacteriia bacterium]